jgi:hypothetical protein
MEPNQLYVRYTQLGGAGWAGVFALAAAIVSGRIVWRWIIEGPRALGIESATLLVLLVCSLSPPGWRAIVRAGGLYRARGLLARRLNGLAIVLLVLGILFGLVFPVWLAIELTPGLRSGVVALGVWPLVAYAAKVGLALWGVRAGVQLLRENRRKDLVESPGAA